MGIDLEKYKKCYNKQMETLDYDCCADCCKILITEIENLKSEIARLKAENEKITNELKELIETHNDLLKCRDADLPKILAENKRLKKTLNKLMPNNPYPEDIFIEPTKEQYAIFHSILKTHGLTLDKFSGAVGRRVWQALTAELRDTIKQALEEVKGDKS